MKELFIETRILRYMGNHPEGVPSRQMTAWLQSIRRYDITWQDIENALYRMRDDGTLACTNKVWHKRRALRTQSPG